MAGSSGGCERVMKVGTRGVGVKGMDEFLAKVADNEQKKKKDAGEGKKKRKNWAMIDTFQQRR